MNPNDSSQPSPASEVWRRFVGMFGGDAVERKYGKTIPPEWIAMLSRLKQFEIDRGIRRLAYSGKQHVPALPEFVKLCRSIGDDSIDEGRPKLAALPSPDSSFDRWAIEANTHFLGYVTRRLADDPRAWGPPKSAEQAECTRIAVQYKNAWAQDMREGKGTTTEGEFIEYPPDEQKALWESVMRSAEEAIALSRAGAAA